MLEITDRNGRVVTIEAAIVGSLDERSYGTGTVEGLRDDVDSVQKMLGQIVSKLHDKGVLGDADVVDLLNWRFSARQASDT